YQACERKLSADGFCQCPSLRAGGCGHDSACQCRVAFFNGRKPDGYVPVSDPDFHNSSWKKLHSVYTPSGVYLHNHGGRYDRRPAPALESFSDYGGQPGYGILDFGDYGSCLGNFYDGGRNETPYGRQD